ncbi:putative lysozyme [Operophtera brumata]|uniref:Lysozyme n=1 Tax=Operophtera brumata TaxID=104452 RepID=A0A0L7LHH3_OPEBR|nr:putative lysozyme [Operophtera brumata]
MIRNAWWTCTLLAVVYARIYDRCDLARELQSLGVRHEQISTWVCIAYHESRFDTAANNAYSGDHGIFQISELYWCGGGKACGLPCDALRDENIADDLQCAQRVHEEHTRLQGDGFLAWVVYPQHCQGNTKKYLASCGLRSGFGRMMEEAHSFGTENSIKNNQNIDNLLPPYLTVSSFFDKHRTDLNYNNIINTDSNYKYDKVDELKLPVLGHKVNEVPEFVTKVDKLVPAPVSSTMTTKSTTTYVSPVIPRRYIETNQFRVNGTTTAKPITKQEFAFEKYTSVPRYNALSTKSTTKQEKLSFEKYTASSTNPSATESTTHKSMTTVTRDISPKIAYVIDRLDYELVQVYYAFLVAESHYDHT